MAKTPKPVRRAIKRAKKDVSTYFGLPVKAKLKKTNNKMVFQSRTKFKNNKPTNVVEIDRRVFLKGATKGIINGKNLSAILKHEFGHSLHDTHSIVKVGKNAYLNPYVSEAMAFLSAFDVVAKNNPRKNRNTKIIRSLTRVIFFNKLNVHKVGAMIAINIIQAFPKRKQRRQYLKKLISSNKRVLSELEDGEE
ncbi:MAG: hypothetical protein COT90_05740, partial [Candidatus Diapherotrites archaeon CG10_big_fil_rev_8_21_14_0_10_31_34]